MARGTTLKRLMDMLRVEADLSLNPAHNNEAHQHQAEILRSTQEALYDSHAWPHMQVERQVQVQAGQRYYDLPEDMVIDKLQSVQFHDAGVWYKLRHGIGAPEYYAYSSDLDQRAWPVQAWRIHEGEMIELWPICDRNADPATLDGYLKFIGGKKVPPLVDANDRCVLDDQLVVLYAALNILSAKGSKKTEIVSQRAQSRLRDVRAGLSKHQGFKMFSAEPTRPSGRIMIGSYRPPE